MPVDPAWVQNAGSVTLLPILHGRVEFCRSVREAIKELSPDLVAVELPSGCESLFSEAVDRFPRLSFITAADLEGGDQDGGAPLWRIEPTDPFCEAIRTARELEIKVVFVDRHTRGYPSRRDGLPDPYSATGLGLGRYYEACRKILEARPNDPRQKMDEAREEAMAITLRRLSKDRRVVFVGGLKHIEPLKQKLQREGELNFVEDPTVAAPLPPLRIYHPSPRTVRTLAAEMPFLTCLYELRRGGPGPEETWQPRGVEEEPEPEEPAPQEPKLDRDSLYGSLSRLLGMKIQKVKQDLTPAQLRQLHAYLNSLQPESWVPPTFDDPQAEDGPAVVPAVPSHGQGRFFTYKTSEQRRDVLLGEYQKINDRALTEDLSLDRQQVLKGLVELAGRFYEENTGETFKQWQHDNFNRFSRRYAALQGRLLPDLLPAIYAARACVDHNYAYEFWDLATFYPWQEEEPKDAPLFHFDGKELEIDGVRLRHFQLQRTFPRLRRSFQQMPLKERSEPTTDPHDWSGAFESGRICSYPPEDIVIEDYGRYLQKKAIKVQSEAHSRTEPFTTSLLDGIDMRTTLRNWADGQKLYVREERKIFGGTGSVVLVFDEDLENKLYPWCITWHGEHDQESDMAFYATDRRKKVIGPGIARCEYGGLMLSYPPRRLANVWDDPHYAGAKTKAEVLLFAAIDYCQDKHVLYVGSQAPRSFFFSLAQRVGKKLVYLPIGTLSPTSLERIRVFHVLAGHRYRELAKDFIW